MTLSNCSIGGLKVLMEGNGIRFAGAVDTMYHVAPAMAATLLPFAAVIEGLLL